MSLNDKQLSFIITFFVMSIVALVLFNIHLSGIKEPEYLLELAPEELWEEIPEPIIEEKVEQELVKTHMAYNEAAKSRFDKELDEFKTLEELMEEAKEAESEDTENTDDTSNEDSDNENNDDEKDFLTSSGGSGSINSASKVKKRTLDSDGNNTTEEISKNNVANRNTSISYSLKDRMHRKLPNPIYTCAQNGKIVINIKVDNQGNVIEATFNQASSNSRNGCLVDNAIAYALKAKFENNSGKREQIGTITYLFQNH
ncbi:hypothetical protein GWK08_14075 [Leptobacterium flavescens]|uniref:Energy transducer TonB n=1 Tax=Leptobacterium flavescens TaxID=472055 RepID=A0A6P0URI3_9FLAO|nr:RPC7 family DNA-directed RNA polymerase III subunit [Leptobacterium flavescens]NER14578.1 hypothetical protein [Leptobacterium flavescens]